MDANLFFSQKNQVYVHIEKFSFLFLYLYDIFLILSLIEALFYLVNKACMIFRNAMN